MKNKYPFFLAVVLSLLSLVVIGLVFIQKSSPTLPPQPSSAVGSPIDRKVPNITLIGENSKAVSLSSFRGKTVVFTDFLTLCQEACPMTTAAFSQMQQTINKDHLSNKIVFVEATVDPKRDTPARLAAYAKLTGATWPLLTGTRTNLDKLWKFFGVYHKIIPPPNPPGIDWLTGKPLTYDVAHTDALFIIGPHGNERFVSQGIPNVGGKLTPALYKMLDPLGKYNLKHPDGWSVPQALSAIAWVARTPIKYHPPKTL